MNDVMLTKSSHKRKKVIKITKDGSHESMACVSKSN